MPATSRMSDPLRTATALSPVIFSLGDPDLLVELLSSNPAGVVLVQARAELPVVFANETFQRWAPAASRPVVGASLPELFSWADRPAIRTAYREVVRSGRPKHVRAIPYQVGHGGATRIGLWSASHYPLRGPTGQVTHVLTFTTEVVDHTAADDRLDEVRQRMLTTLAGVVRHLAGDADPDAFFAELSATVAGLVEASQVVFWRYEAATEAIAPQPGGFGLGDEELAAVAELPCRPGGAGVMEQVVFDDVVLRGDVAAGDPRFAPYRPLVHRLQRRDVVAIPWTAGEQRLGALAAYGSTRPAGFQEEDVWV